MRILRHGDTVAASLRSGTNFELLSPFNDKTPKGEAAGYLTAILYLAPHTLAGGKSVCPHSTEACRAGCLFTAGRGGMPKVEAARIRRTKLFLADRLGFLRQLVAELTAMQRVADANRMKLAIRLNGTSDILWEREVFPARRSEVSLFDLFPRARFYDYCRVPLAHRKVPGNWHLTYSLADAPIETGLTYLEDGRNVAIVMPRVEIERAPASIVVRGREVHLVHGDDDDLRFLDPSPSVVMLKPKGDLRRGGPMVRSGVIDQLRRG